MLMPFQAAQLQLRAKLNQLNQFRAAQFQLTHGTVRIHGRCPYGHPHRVTLGLRVGYRAILRPRATTTWSTAPQKLQMGQRLGRPRAIPTWSTAPQQLLMGKRALLRPHAITTWSTAKPQKGHRAFFDPRRQRLGRPPVLGIPTQSTPAIPTQFDRQDVVISNTIGTTSLLRPRQMPFRRASTAAVQLLSSIPFPE